MFSMYKIHAYNKTSINHKSQCKTFTMPSINKFIYYAAGFIVIIGILFFLIKKNFSIIPQT
jgi:hypothetical protein